MLLVFCAKPYFYNDHLGSRRAVTTNTGTVQAKIDYTVWGVPMVTNYNGYEGSGDIPYTGKEYDATKLYYFNARYYYPSIMRFITEDPARDEMNWYAYCGNSPTSSTDPTGLDVGNAGNDGYDEYNNPTRVEDYSVVTSGDDVCVSVTTIAGSATNESQRESMKSHPEPRTSEIILVKENKVVSSKIEGGVPKGYDIFANVAQAKTMSPTDFYNAVKNHGPWDYKQQGSQYQDFGNWNYGLTGKAARFPDSVLLRMAGWAQHRAGTSKPEWGGPLGGPPYGDDPADQAVITSGMYFYGQAF